MSYPRLLLALALLAVAAPRSAEAADHVVYLHGRSMSTWPAAAYLGASASWSHVTLAYNGSSRLTNSTARTAINNALASYCGGANRCVIACYSAGCARMFLAFSDLKAEGRYPANILWTEAIGSAAGGSEVSEKATKWWVRLMAKLFNTDSAEPIDYDIKPGVMRNNYGYIQNQATTPVYHMAGSSDICVTLRILWLVKIKLCGNKEFPGHYGDGVVPVHSAAGYADTAAHANHADGAAKYVFRAYEQTPLFAADHRGIFGPLVFYGSLRLAVNKNASCPNMPAVDPNLPDASIVYDDGDGAYTDEFTPLFLLNICGNDVWNGDAQVYATCLGAGACCTAFSTGDAGGCSCGEALCIQPKIARRSYFTGDNCSGTEYSDGVSGNVVSHDGLGMAGNVTTSVTVRSARTWPSGTCQPLVRRVTWNGGCAEYYLTSKAMSSMRRVYRPGVTTYAPDPNTAGEWDGIVVSSTNYNAMCP